MTWSDRPARSLAEALEPVITVAPDLDPKELALARSNVKRILREIARTMPGRAGDRVRAELARIETVERDEAARKVP